MFMKIFQIYFFISIVCAYRLCFQFFFFFFLYSFFFTILKIVRISLVLFIKKKNDSYCVISVFRRIGFWCSTCPFKGLTLMLIKVQKQGSLSYNFKRSKILVQGNFLQKAKPWFWAPSSKTKLWFGVSSKKNNFGFRVSPNTEKLWFRVSSNTEKPQFRVPSNKSKLWFGVTSNKKNLVLGYLQTNRNFGLGFL